MALYVREAIAFRPVSVVYKRLTVCSEFNSSRTMASALIGFVITGCRIRLGPIRRHWPSRFIGR